MLPSVFDQVVTAKDYAFLLAWISEYGLPDLYNSTGTICASTFNAQGGKTDPADFIPYLASFPKPAFEDLPLQSPEEQRAIFAAKKAAAAKAHGHQQVQPQQ